MKLFCERRFGLSRAAIVDQGRPVLYGEGRALETSSTVLGARCVGRLSARSAAVGFVQLPDGQQAIIDTAKTAYAEGAMLEVEIMAEARADKLARARVLGMAEGSPRRLSPAVDMADRLKSQVRALIAPDASVEQVTDESVAEWLDAAEAGALEVVARTGQGGTVAIEPTRALIACDVDLGTAAEGLAGNAKTASRKVNEQAVVDIVRRLRLSNLAGLVIIDLIGTRHDYDRLKALASAAFGAEADHIGFGPPNRFGTLQFTRPWGATPHRDLYDTPLRAARRLLWRVAHEARGDAGGLFAVRAPARVLEVAAQGLKDDPLSARLRLEADEKAVKGAIIRLN